VRLKKLKVEIALCKNRLQELRLLVEGPIVHNPMTHRCSPDWHAEVSRIKQRLERAEKRRAELLAA
jgi:hypothetical protein